MNRAENKASRLLQIENLLLGHPEGLTQAEIARRLDVDRSTIHRDLLDVPGHIYTEDDGRLKIDRTADLINVRLNLHEALSVHIAARLLATRMDRQNPHAASALRKLGLAMERWAARISRHVLQSADVMDEAAQRHDPVYLQALEKLTQAWADQRKAQIWHHSEVADKVMEYTFSPYFIEPYAVGQTTHVIGLADPPGKIRTFKIERIKRVEISRDPYDLPGEFDPRRLLADAWGIWYSDNEPAEVVLKFHPRVAKRVQETRWHRSAEEKELPDGSLLWLARVAEPQEMLPWIRGWGADCEVLEPAGLRKALEREAKKLARLYGVTEEENIPSWFNLWAKTEKSQSPDTHPLIYHLIDVGECALALWQFALSVQTRQAFANWLNLDQESAGRQIAFWAALHDLGKSAPGFQRKYPPAIPALEKQGFAFPSPTLNPAPHGILSAWALANLLVSVTRLSKADARAIAGAVGGHHGNWPTNDKLGPAALQSADKGGSEWDKARRDLFQVVHNVYQPVDGIGLPHEDAEHNSFLTLFSGLVSVADWIGSMSQNFPFEEEYLPAKQYATLAGQRAAETLEKLGWMGWQATGEMRSFNAMFPEIPRANPVQETVFQSAENADLPALLILEAPTGIGKTEAALYLADRWLQARQGRGMYIAMPTQATSNQMYGRVVNFLISRYPAQTINAHLVHGAALLSDSEENLEPQGIALDDKDAQEKSIRAETWFLPRKRTLLAPFGVGTVDQALLGVLQTNHFFVRLFGLGQKVVVFDEVHAYDTYMSTLFQRLLGWLRSIGTSVILLSATLPEDTRKKMVQAWLGDEEAELPPAAYPRMTLATPAGANSIALPAPADRSLLLDWIEPDPPSVAKTLDEALQNGGCAAVICNRVQRAQDVYKAIQAARIVEPENLILFHARFPFQWRKETEECVLSLFSKNGQRPHKAIVVATQVIEQSLDLDFDYMVSDLAPVDLLIQRAGRLHRHPRNQPNRPTKLQTPTLAVCAPTLQDELPNFGADKFIYDESTLLATWLVLKERITLLLPAETEMLIESVYGDNPTEDFPQSIAHALEKARENARKSFEKETLEAKKRIIAKADYEDLLIAPNERLEEDDSHTHEAFRALTRLGDPMVSIICLHQTAQGIALEPGGTGAPINPAKRPNRTLASQLLSRAVSIQRRDVVNYFTGHDERKSDWKRSALVHQHHPVVFDEQGEYRPQEAGFYFKLTRELGLQVFKTEEAK